MTTACVSDIFAHTPLLTFFSIFSWLRINSKESDVNVTRSSFSYENATLICSDNSSYFLMRPKGCNDSSLVTVVLKCMCGLRVICRIGAHVDASNHCTVFSTDNSHFAIDVNLACMCG